MSEPKTPGKTSIRTRWYTLNGEKVTLRQLATLAGCSYAAMVRRVQFHEPAEAVAMGASSRSANACTSHLAPYRFPVTRKEPPPRPEYDGKRERAAKEMTRVITLNGQPTTILALAALAGCSWDVMRYRLKNNSPEQAVAMGPADRQRNHHSKRAEAAKPEPKRTRQAKCPVPRTDDYQRRVKPGSKLEATLEWRGAKLDDAEVITPPNVKRTTWPTPPDRFAVQPRGNFGRIGQYERTGSAIERALADELR